jgi:hypothetical protein
MGEPGWDISPLETQEVRGKQDRTECTRGTVGVGLARGSAEGGLAAHHAHRQRQEAQDGQHAHISTLRGVLQCKWLVGTCGTAQWEHA